MNIYRIKITLADGCRVAFTALFASSTEAVQHMLADYPDARAVSALLVKADVAAPAPRLSPALVPARQEGAV